MTILDRLTRSLGLMTGAALALRPPAEPREAAPVVAPALPEMDFVVIDVETACGRASSICQIGIVGFAGAARCWLGRR